MIPHSLQFIFSNGIIFLLLWFGMVTAIHFYYKTAVSGNEIYDVITYYMLSEKVNPKSFIS